MSEEKRPNHYKDIVRVRLSICARGSLFFRRLGLSSKKRANAQT
jgi:hypothetical protein